MLHEIVLFNGNVKEPLEILGSVTTETYNELEELISPTWLRNEFSTRLQGLKIVPVNGGAQRFYLYKDGNLFGVISARRINS